jgi:hypothetical protein
VKKSLASGVGVAAALVVVFGSGSAGAINEYVGQTYEKAAASISNYGGTAVIATRIGEYLPTEQCIVSGSHNSNGKVLLDLNCNDTYAGKTGHSGNSAATPEGQQALKWIQRARAISEDYAKATADGTDSYCATDANWCTRICQQSGTCSSELSQFLGL